MVGQVSAQAFDIDVTREAGYWVAVARGVRGGATEARRLADLDVEVRDLLSGLLDVDPDTMELTWHYDTALPATAVDRVRAWIEAQVALEGARREYENAQTRVVEELTRADVSVRDAAVLTGLSFQRVQQVRVSSRQTPRRAGEVKLAKGRQANSTTGASKKANRRIDA
jgi:hypothetical protein